MGEDRSRSEQVEAWVFGPGSIWYALESGAGHLRTKAPVRVSIHRKRLVVWILKYTGFFQLQSLEEVIIPHVSIVRITERTWQNQGREEAQACIICIQGSGRRRVE